MDAKIANTTSQPPTVSLPGAVARCLLFAWILLMTAPVVGANPKPLPSRIRKGDILIWDEQYLRGSPKGWQVPADYHETFGRNGSVRNGIRYGRYGLLSGRFLYTTWRPIQPLSDAIYAEGKVAVFDNHVSDLVTPAFELKLDYVTFLLSGGKAPNEACINLLVDGKVVRTATGRNDDVLEFVAFDVRALRGSKAQIQVLDTSTAAFGYITVDCICQSPNPKGAVRVITGPPSTASTAGARAEMVTGRLSGVFGVVDGRLLVGGKAVDLKGLLLLETGVKSAGDVSGQRLVLVNGDVLKADILNLEDGKLVIRHAVFGEMRVAVNGVAQAVFIPGPSSKAEPSVLVHSKGSLIPGELLWIREDNIAIKCSLGTVPLPRGRVRGYVFGRVAPRADDVDTVMLADGSSLSGKLSLDKQGFVITHDALGLVKLTAADVVRIARRLPGVVRLTDLRGKVAEQVGPIPPPAPVRVGGESGGALRIFPRTVVRYTLGQSAHTRRFRAALAPVAGARVPVTVSIRAGDKKWSGAVSPEASGVDIDIDLGRTGELEIVVDSPKTVAYPCGVELRNGFIVKDGRP